MAPQPADGARLMVVHDLYFKTIPQQLGWRARLTNDLIFRLMLSGQSKIITVRMRPSLILSIIILRPKV
jgi:hypothetical protein